MGLGFREMLFLLFLLALGALFIACIVWFANRSGRNSYVNARPRPTADRLAELESLRQAGQISSEEYEKHRASIISDV
jgi:cytochrome c-type biogenesis protein CcmH/NrfG